MPDRNFSRWRPHPWHGLEVGPDAPSIVHAYIEITPFDRVKYEIDKHSGYLRVDRPQRSTAMPPALYGFVPQTYCGDRVAAISPSTGEADGDPLDICVLSERPINHPEVLLDARVLGGISMLDDGEADDKIIAVLANDNIWSEVRDVSELPAVMVERLRHYFSTYKWVPEGGPSRIQILEVYDRDRACQVIEASMADYQERFADT